MNNNNFFASSLLLVLGLAACGDNVDNLRPDARRTTDAPPMIDGPPGADAAIDAAGAPDAAASTVTVTPGLCGAGEDHRITNMGNAFVLDGNTALLNPPMVFNVGDEVSIATGMSHNFASDTGTPPQPQFEFRSGNFGVDACLTFTAAIPASAGVDYVCEAHPSMTNTLVVLP